jgi:hypothetical protein
MFSNRHPELDPLGIDLRICTVCTIYVLYKHISMIID